jgi:hypothetical protein
VRRAETTWEISTQMEDFKIIFSETVRTATLLASDVLVTTIIKCFVVQNHEHSLNISANTSFSRSVPSYGQDKKCAWIAQSV